MTTHFLTKTSRALTGRGSLAAGLAMALAACGGSIVDAPTDDIILPPAIDNVGSLPTVLNGVRSDYALAFDGDNGGTEGLILVSGLVADEFNSGDTFPTRVEMDRRNMREINTSLEAVERNLHRTRASAERAVEAFRRLTPDDGVSIAELLGTAALVDIAFGENYCSGVPSSRLNGAELEYGTPRTTAQMFATAIARTDSALTALTGLTGGRATYIRNRTNVLRGRALLNNGQFAAAAAAVATVPTAFRDTVPHSNLNGSTINGVFAFNSPAIARWTVANGTGANPGGSAVIAFGAAADPRIPTQLTGGATFDGRSALRVQLKYPGPTAPTEVTTGAEARLIEAEAALQAGDAVTFINRLNEARANNGRITGLAPLTDPGTPVARENLLFRERALWLFATAHRLGDARRLIRQYLRTQDAVLPTGNYFKGGVYGTDVNIPVTQDERNNASFTGCLNRDA